MKARIHATLLAFGHPCPVSDLFGTRGRALLAGLALPEPWNTNVRVSLELIDHLDAQVTGIEQQLRSLGADHRYVALLTTLPGVAWILGYTIAAEIGDISRFSTPTKLIGHTGLTPKVIQSGEMDRRGPLTKNGPRYLRWAYIEAAQVACRYHPFHARYQHTKQRLGRSRGAKVAAFTVARSLAEATWWMLTRNQPFAPAGATAVLAA